MLELNSSGIKNIKKSLLNIYNSLKQKFGGDDHLPFITLFFLTLIFHTLYLFLTGFDLAPDEAHYWEWSRRLGLSYYSKGPGVAYIIAFFTSIFGNNAFAVRFGSVVLIQILTLVSYLLCYRLFYSKFVAFLLALIMQFIPLFAAGSFLMTTDPIYITFWALSVFAVYKVVETENPKYFYLYALCLGLGFLGKYAMLVNYFCLLLFFLTSHNRRILLNKTHFYVSHVLILVLFLPVIIWTIKHDFVNFLHVFYQGKNQSANALISFKYFFEFLGGQIGVVSPLLFILIVWAVFYSFKQRRDVAQRDKIDLLLSFGLFVFIIYFLMSFKVRIHPNWPAVSYVTLLILTAGMLANVYNKVHARGKIFLQRYIYATFILAIFIVFLGYSTDALRVLVVKIFPENIQESSLLHKPVNKILAFIHNPKKDPTNRLKGWKELGAYIDTIMEGLNEEDFFIFSSQYQVAGEVAFYTKKQYRTYCINLGRRLNQYDIWDGWDSLYGKNAIQVEDTKTNLNEKVINAFERCEKHSYFEAKRAGKVIKDWTIFRCFNFKGLEEIDQINSY